MRASTLIAVIAGGALGGAFALAGYAIAGSVGAVVGILLTIPLAALLGIAIGNRA